MTYLEIEPARAKLRDPSDMWGSTLYVAEEKMNGWRYLMHLDGRAPRVYMTGRRVSQETGFLSEKGEQVPMLWPEWKGEYTVIDGEVMPPEGANFRDIAGIMNADIESAQKRIEVIGPPRYFAFDILYHQGEDIRDMMLIERRKILQRVVEQLNHPLINCILQMPPERARYEEIVARGGEGVVLKDISASYGDGWTKVKKFFTLDVIITGFTEARKGRTGKYLGQIGAAVVSVYTSTGELVEVAQVSGMTDDVRAAMSANRQDWIGQVIEIEAQEWGKDRLLHPRYARPRPDLGRQVCTFSKMMQDLGREEKPWVDPRQLSLL